MAYKLTKTLVESLPYPDDGQMFYRDSELKGFGVRVGTGSKVYFAEGKIGGNKTVRVTIGRHGVFTAEEARNEARSILGLIARGVNPNDVEKTKKARSVTLSDAVHTYLKARNSLKPTTARDYERLLNTYLADWKEKALVDISKDLVERMHRKIGERSPAQANLSMRFLRAIFNFAIAQYEDSDGNPIIPDNPVKRISQTRSWYRIEKRHSVIKAHDLPAWFDAVSGLANDQIGRNRELIRDYLLLIIFTGLRRGEAASLRWKNVDLKARTLTIPDPKNRVPHVLPLTDFTYQLLKNRYAATGEDSPFVFPGDGVTGYLNEPRKQMQKVTAESGVDFTLHDLRRTFITVAESLDIPAYALKRLLNHKMTNDVTAGYIISDVERLRAPMQKITDYLLKCGGVIPSAEIIELSAIKNN